MIRSRGNFIKKEVLKIIYFRLINRFVRNGKKDFILTFFFNALFKLKMDLKVSFRMILDRFFLRLRPLLQLKPLFSSGIVYQLPSTLNSSKEFNMAVYWFYQAVKQRTEHSLQHRISFELFDVWHNKGSSLQLKRDYYSLIVQNRIFLYRFKRKFNI